MEDLDKLMESFQKDLDTSLKEINENLQSLHETDSTNFTNLNEDVSEPLGMTDDWDDLDSDESLEDGTVDPLEEDISDELEFRDITYNDEYQGIIFTNTSILAEKYSTSQLEVKTIINNYLFSLEDVGVKLYLLDMGNWRLMNNSWESYYAILSSKLDDLNINDPDKTLFIIGGDDVIPMPKMLNPLSNVGSEYLDVDMRYCYPSGNFKIDDARVFVRESPRCNVGRFPLESGEMHSDIGDDLEEYLCNAINIWCSDGMDINGATMTTTESWLPSSREMMRDVPTTPIESDLLTVRSNMLVSPDLDLYDVEYNSEFVNNASSSDFLIFNLHGSDDYDSSSYYGEDRNHSEYPNAFLLDTVHETSPSIITATACYGARFIGYDRSHSMLLTAMTSGTMLFVGSCTTALGRGNGNSATDLLIPAGMSESMLKLYNTYLCLGHPAGRALLDAKIDYYHTCSDIDGNMEALATIMMFNLYGDPLLFMKPLLDEQFEMKAIRNSALRNNKDLNFTPTQIKSIYSKKLDTTSDVLAAVRNCVDSNLSFIHNAIQENLYKTLGLEKKFLENISVESVNGVQKSIDYTYRMKKGPIEQIVIAKMDNDGKLRDLITTK